MSGFLEDPSVLTKEKLKSELLAHNVQLPSGDQRKDVYVQLYLKTLTLQNQEKSQVTDTFSSDEDLPPPVVTNASRSGRVRFIFCPCIQLVSGLLVILRCTCTFDVYLFSHCKGIAVNNRNANGFN